RSNPRSGMPAARATAWSSASDSSETMWPQMRPWRGHSGGSMRTVTRPMLRAACEEARCILLGRRVLLGCLAECPGDRIECLLDVHLGASPLLQHVREGSGGPA